MVTEASPVRAVLRPVVRAFRETFSDRAAEWVRRGGHAVVWASPKRARLVIRKPDPADKTDLGRWAMFDLDIHSWRVERAGHFRGLATAKVPPRHAYIVVHWAERDSIHRGPVRSIRLDCAECGACCRKNEVLLKAADIARLPELAGAAFSRRRKDGKRVLRLLPSKDCKFLGKGNRCGIYEHRPDACREFPVGSESCLFSREDELGLVDG